MKLFIYQPIVLSFTQGIHSGKEWCGYNVTEHLAFNGSYVDNHPLFFKVLEIVIHRPHRERRDRRLQIFKYHICRRMRFCAIKVFVYFVSYFGVPCFLCCSGHNILPFDYLPLYYGIFFFACQ